MEVGYVLLTLLFQPEDIISGQGWPVYREGHEKCFFLYWSSNPDLVQEVPSLLSMTLRFRF